MPRLTYNDLERIYHEVKVDLLRYLALRCGQVDAAEDLLQAVFIKLIPVLRAGRLDAEAVRPYLFRMARNEMMDWFRRKSVEQKFFESVGTLRTDPDPVAEGQDARIAEVVDSVLGGDALTDRQKELLQMRLIGRMAMEDVAAALEIGRSTAYRELEVGLGRLQQALTEAGLSPDDLAS